MDNEASPLPWRREVHEDMFGGKYLEVYDANGDVVELRQHSPNLDLALQAVNAFPELTAENKRLREALKETLTVATKLRNEMSDLVDLVGLIAERHPKDVDEVFESDTGFVVYRATTPDFLSEEFDEAEEKARAALDGKAGE